MPVGSGQQFLSGGDGVVFTNREWNRGRLNGSLTQGLKYVYNTKCDFTIIEMETCHFAHSRRKSWPTLKKFVE